MPHSVPVSNLMLSPNSWPQLRADAEVRDAIKLLRILSEDEKLEHGRSTPLVFDDNYNLVGLIRLTDLLQNVRHLCDQREGACDLGDATRPIKELVKKFPGYVSPDDSILKALDIMIDNSVTLVPVLKEGKLVGMLKLGDIFNTISSLLFDEENPMERSRIMKYL
ncbi:MAG: cyclic nucleotide-binding/CBS domain-containing protein, partial [Desulfomonilaceae bacterium]